jgi:hypothetical protein
MKAFEPLIGEWHGEGEISADARTIEGRWERGMGDSGDAWELDLPINYVRG